MHTTRSMKTSMEGFTFPLFLFSLYSILIISNAADTITETQSIADGDTIVSSSEIFEMGFFSPANSNNRYVGIWYANTSSKTVVWIANREIPLTDTSGVLKIIQPGILVLLKNSTSNNITWSTNTSRSVQNPVVQLLDSGNLVVRDANDDDPDNFLWQGFDYPCDTFLPGMKLGKNLVTGREWHISSWKSNNDPARGDYTFWLDLRGYPQVFISNSTDDMFRAGPWNGVWFTGVPIIGPNPVYNFGMHFENREVYFGYDLRNSSVLSRYELTSNGYSQLWTLFDRSLGWVLYVNVPTATSNCNAYKFCGPYGSCDIDKSPSCSCLNKFVPKYPEEYLNTTNWSSGCVRRRPLDCKNGDGFLKYLGIKLPDTQNSWFNVTMTLGECEEVCLKNCSCMAYTSLDIRGGGSGCLLWFDDLVDIRVFSNDGQDIYIRVASSELDNSTVQLQQIGSDGKKREILIVTLTAFTGMLLLGLSMMLYFRKKKKNSQLKMEGNQTNQKDDLELPLFDLAIIANSTNNFSIDNKLGEGGFGAVYVGRLEDGQEIAIKRLSKFSSQGIDEFKNEVICIAKLQHRNLVKLLGCCIEGEEKMLIYEFMPNKSLDCFIFDEIQRSLLDWPQRYHIINGIARGLLYLHQDSRLRIIHRDLKASNVLLDAEMNPKISDFGLARSFGENETQGNTNRIAGTYGYMSPEYAVDGLFSVKSDVFSFGVIVLEIVSGKRNRGFFHPDHQLNLLGHAWRLYKEERSLDLIDSAVRDSCCLHEVLRSIHVGLLCVQQHPESRPSMSSVVLMLGGEGVLSLPKQPGFFTERNLTEAGTSSSSSHAPSLANDFTITIVEPR